MGNTKEHNMELVRAFWNDDENLESELEFLLESYPTRAEQFAKIAELCLPATTNEELFFISKSYVWAGAAYRLKAIEYLKKYINAGAICEETPDGTRNVNGILYDLKSLSIADVYTDLGNCYAGEYEFDQAIECFRQAYSLAPYIPSNAVKISEMHVKKNELYKALDFLQVAKGSSYYAFEDFRSVIDKYILDVQRKIENGYIYRPRKKK